jgi:serine/threonine protein kinase
LSSIVSIEELELDPIEASDLRRWLSDEHSRGEPLSSGYQGAVYLYEGPSGQRIIKEALGSGLQYRIGRSMLRREFAAYRRVNGIEGIPHCYGLLDDRFLVLEYIVGIGFRDAQLDHAARENFLQTLLQIIQQMHAEGVTHNDIKRKDNLMVSDTGRPILLDFGLAFMRGASRESLWFRLLKRMDYNAWIKIKYSSATENISDADLKYYQPTFLESGFRQWRRLWRTITLRQWRKMRVAEDSKVGKKNKP